MRVFIAGSLKRKAILAWVQDDLKRKFPKIDFVATWMYFNDDPTDAYAEWKQRGQLWRNLEELQRADIIIIDAVDSSSTGGYTFEAGMTLGLNKPRFRVGDNCNLYVKMVSQYHDRWSDIEKLLARL